MNVTIRTAAAEDLDALSALYRDYFQDLKQCGLTYDLNTEKLPGVIEARIRSRLVLAAVAENESGKICGFVYCSVLRIGNEFLCNGSASVGFINDIYVAPQERNRGLSGNLLDYARQWLLDQGITAMEAQILTGNTKSQRFFQKHGFAPTGSRYANTNL